MDLVFTGVYFSFSKLATLRIARCHADSKIIAISIRNHVGMRHPVLIILPRRASFFKTKAICLDRFSVPSEFPERVSEPESGVSPEARQDRLARINHKLRSETPCEADWDQAGEGSREDCMGTYCPNRDSSPTQSQPASRKSLQLACDLYGLARQQKLPVPYDHPFGGVRLKAARPSPRFAAQPPGFMSANTISGRLLWPANTPPACDARQRERSIPSTNPSNPHTTDGG